MTQPSPRDSSSGQPIARAPAPPSTGSVGDGNLAEPIKLGEFLEGIAAIYDLPARDVVPSVAPQQPKKTTKRRRSKFELWLVAVPALAVMATLVIRLSLAEPPLSILPSVLEGGWETTNVDYRDREFWLSATRVAFQTGPYPEDVTVHPIRRVIQTTARGDTTDFAIDYESEGGVVTWKFQFTSSPKPVIRFVNQKALIWTPDLTRTSPNPLVGPRR